MATSNNCLAKKWPYCRDSCRGCPAPVDLKNSANILYLSLQTMQSRYSSNFSVEPMERQMENLRILMEPMERHMEHLRIWGSLWRPWKDIWSIWWSKWSHWKTYEACEELRMYEAWWSPCWSMSMCGDHVEPHLWDMWSPLCPCQLSLIA